MKSMKIRNHAPAFIIIALFTIILVAGFWSVLSHLNPSMSGVQDFVSDRLGDRSPLSVIRNLSQDMTNETNLASNLNRSYTSPLKWKLNNDMSNRYFLFHPLEEVKLELLSVPWEDFERYACQYFWIRLYDFISFL